MFPVIFLSLLVAATAAALFYLFSESKVELDSPTIAAMEAHTEALEARRKTELEYEEHSIAEEQEEHFGAPSVQTADDTAASRRLPRMIEMPDYEYREMLKEGSGNYVLPPWIVNFFSSSDICHTLDRANSVVVIVRLNDPKNAETGIIDISADCDMSTQTVALKLCLGEGAAAEAFKTKFYLFERGDLFELSRLARQDNLRMDILTRAPDYTLEYVNTVHAALPPSVRIQLKTALTKISA